MIVVSIHDFRANQSKYLELAAGGESVILTSRPRHRKAQAYECMPPRRRFTPKYVTRTQTKAAMV